MMAKFTCAHLQSRAKQVIYDKASAKTIGWLPYIKGFKRETSVYLKVSGVSKFVIVSIHKFLQLRKNKVWSWL